MAAPFHTVLSKCDRALVAYLVFVRNAGTLSDTYPAKRALDKTAPNTTCWSSQGTEEPQYSGNYRVKVAIMVKTSGAPDTGDAAGTQEAASEARVGTVFDCFKTGLDSSGDKLADVITAAARAAAAAGTAGFEDLADFTMFNLQDAGIESGFESTGNVWVDTLNLEVWCVPKDVE